MPPMPKVKEKHWGNTEGGDRLNGTVVGRRYGRPCDRHPARGPGVVHVEASAGIRAGVRSQTMTGWEGEGGGGGEYKGECLFDDDREEDEYDDDNEYEGGWEGVTRGSGRRGGIQLRRLRHRPRAVLWQHGAEDVD
jgi:hypothetical protein